MAGIATFEMGLWALTEFLQGLLLLLLIRKRNYRVLPAFSLYILLVLAQNIAFFIVYYRWGFGSRVAWTVAWGTQAVVLCARGVAAVEVCRRILSGLPGVWRFAKGILVASAGIVAVYSVSAAKHQWRLAFTTAQLSLELAIAAVIVVLLVLARYYGVSAPPPLRGVALGLCLYSCVTALNDAVLQTRLDRYMTLWHVLGTASFLASLSIWIWALRTPAALPARWEVLRDSSLYRVIAREVNARLRELNKALWNLESWRP